MSAAERRLGIVFKAEGDRFGGVLARDFHRDSQAEVDAGGDTARGDPVAVDGHATADRTRPEGGQEFHVSPVGGRLVAFEEPGGPEEQRAGADGGHVLRGPPLRRQKVEDFAVLH